MTDTSPQGPLEDDSSKVGGSEADVPDMSLEDITEGSRRGIPKVKFLDDIEAFANSFTPPAQPELLIGGFSQLHVKYKSTEASLQNKRTCVVVENWLHGLHIHFCVCSTLHDAFFLIFYLLLIHALYVVHCSP
jgi:hypothetical protein